MGEIRLDIYDLWDRFYCKFTNTEFDESKRARAGKLNEIKYNLKSIETFQSLNFNKYEVSYKNSLLTKYNRPLDISKRIHLAPFGENGMFGRNGFYGQAGPFAYIELQENPKPLEPLSYRRGPDGTYRPVDMPDGSRVFRYSNRSGIGHVYPTNPGEVLPPISYRYYPYMFKGDVFGWEESDGTFTPILTPLSPYKVDPKDPSILVAHEAGSDDPYGSAYPNVPNEVLQTKPVAYYPYGFYGPGNAWGSFDLDGTFRPGGPSVVMRPLTHTPMTHVTVWPYGPYGPGGLYGKMVIVEDPFETFEVVGFKPGGPNGGFRPFGRDGPFGIFEPDGKFTQLPEVLKSSKEVVLPKHPFDTGRIKTIDQLDYHYMCEDRDKAEEELRNRPKMYYYQSWAQESGGMHYEGYYEDMDIKPRGPIYSLPKPSTYDWNREPKWEWPWDWDCWN
jgi:hypothetical protein